MGSGDSGDDPWLLLLGLHRHPDPWWLYMSKICSQQVINSFLEYILPKIQNLKDCTPVTIVVPHQ